MAANAPVAKNPSVSPVAGKLPSLSELLNNSWLRLKETGMRLVGLYVLLSVVAIAVVVIGLLVGGGAVLGSAGGFAGLETAVQNPASWLTFGAVFVVAILMASLISNAFSAALILEVDNPTAKTPIGTLIQRGLGMIVPLFVVSLITQFLVLGGFFLFVIPGIVIGVLLSFAMYEVILGGTRGLEALKNSISIVSQNFWGILGRWAAIVGIQIVVMAVFSALSEIDGGLGSLFELASSIFSMFFSLYTLVFGVLLYRAARANTNLTEGKMTWMWPVAVLGWVVGGLLLVLIARAAGSVYNEAMSNPEDFQRMMQEYGSEDDTYMYDGETNSTMDSGDSEYDALFNQMMDDGELTEEELNQLYQEAVMLDEGQTAQ